MWGTEVLPAFFLLNMKGKKMFENIVCYGDMSFKSLHVVVTARSSVPASFKPWTSSVVQETNPFLKMQHNLWDSLTSDITTANCITRCKKELGV